MLQGDVGHCESMVVVRHFGEGGGGLRSGNTAAPLRHYCGTTAAPKSQISVCALDQSLSPQLNLNLNLNLDLNLN